MEIAKNIPRDKLPNWLTKEILEPFDSGLASVFILHGDINCLISDPYTQDQENRSYIKFREFWRKILMDNEMVIFYNIASGIGFLKPGMETEFKKALAAFEEKTLSPLKGLVIDVRANQLPDAIPNSNDIFFQKLILFRSC